MMGFPFSFQATLCFDGKATVVATAACCATAAAAIPLIAVVATVTAAAAAQVRHSAFAPDVCCAVCANTAELHCKTVAFLGMKSAKNYSSCYHSLYYPILSYFFSFDP